MSLEGMKRVFGIETEFGITVDGVENVDVVSESIELVRRYTEHGTLMKWDYSLEDPHQDARGEASARRSCCRTRTNPRTSRSTRTGR